MIAAPLRLDRFDAPAVTAPAADRLADPQPLEEARLAGYESGYAAGWEDAATAHQENGRQARTDLVASLRELSFTYHEARTHVLNGLAPLLRTMTDRILPELARETLGASVVAALMTEAEALSGSPVEVRVAPEDVDTIEPALAETPALPASIVADPALGAGQVRFRFDAEERLLDTGALVASMQRLVADFLHHERQGVLRHG